MNNQALINLSLRRYPLALAASIELLFLEFAFGSLIVGGAPLHGALFAVSLAAPKGTVYILSSGIAKIRQKDNVTLPASFQACLELGMLFYHAAQPPKILSGYLPNPAFAVPLRFKLKKGLKSDNKKAKSSLVWLIRLDTTLVLLHVFPKLMNKRGCFICKEPYSTQVGEFTSAGMTEFSSAL